MTLNTPSEEMANIDAFTSQHGMSKTAFVRKAIRTYLYLRSKTDNGASLYIKEGEKYSPLKM